MLYRGEEMEERAVLQAAAEMCAAARTAPKAHGKDTLRTVVLIGDEKEELARVMERIGEREMGDRPGRGTGATRRTCGPRARSCSSVRRRNRAACRTADAATSRTAPHAGGPGERAPSYSSTSASPSRPQCPRPRAAW